jgi:bile acid:Na+ symporter, BASS family
MSLPEAITLFLTPEAFKIEGLALQVSMMLVVLSLGMSATWDAATFLFRHPRLLIRSIIARNVIIPLAAIAMVKIFAFHQAVAITIGVLAATPVPPLIPKSLLKAAARDCYVFGLLISQAALAIVTVPLIIELYNASFARELHFGPMDVAKVVFKTVLLPIGAGILISELFGDTPRLVGRWIGMVGNVLLICAALPLLIFAWTALQVLVGEGVLAGLAALVIIGLAAGHLLGGPEEHDRTALALATASAHPGVAIAIAGANRPQQLKLVAGAVIIYLILRAILIIPYTRWRRRLSPYGGDVHAPARAYR